MGTKTDSEMKTQDKKKAFLIYYDLINTVRKLPSDKAGELFLLLLKYVNGEDYETNDLLLQVLLEPIKLQIERDTANWEEEKTKRSNAGKKGMESRWGDKNNDDTDVITNDNSVIKMLTEDNSVINNMPFLDNSVIKNITEITDTVTVNVTDTVPVSENVKSNIPINKEGNSEEGNSEEEILERKDKLFDGKFRL